MKPSIPAESPMVKPDDIDSFSKLGRAIAEACKFAPLPPVRSTPDIVAALRASLLERATPIGTTWGSLRWAMAQNGVTDDTLVSSIEIGLAHGKSGRIFIAWKPEGIQVTEV